MNEIRLAAVIVLYKELLQDSDTYKSFLAKSNLPLLVYDNSPNIQQHKVEIDYTLVSDLTNPGVSKAYNEAWIWAKKNNYSHLLLLDSDSSFPENAFHEYLIALKGHEDKLIVPSMISNSRKISPFYFKFGKSHYGENISFGKIQLGKIVAINSGLLIPLSVLNITKGFNENLPLDWSDVYFIRKASNLNVEAIHISLNVEHGLSEHGKAAVDSVLNRFQHQIKGIKFISSSSIENIQMKFWIGLKALKYSLKFRSIKFLTLFFKHLTG